MTKDEALRLALEALEKISMGGDPRWADDAITAIKAALEAPQRTWVNLNLTEIELLFIENTTPKSTAIDFARAIEAKLKERNT